MTDTLTVNDLTFQLRRSTRRKTVAITVDRAGELVVTAPADLDETAISRVVHEKRDWVYQKLAEKQMFYQPQPRRQFVSGEGFFYLGRSYRLKLVEDQDCPLKLLGGRFRLRRRDVANGRAHFVRWYTSHAKTWLGRRLPTWAERLGVQPHGLRVLELGYRWGSCSQDGSINIHWTAIQLPVTVVDYLLVHELAHLLDHSHGPNFWRLIERAIPDFDRRRQWLAEQGQRYAEL